MYIAERWIGGLLTNFEQTTRNLKKLKDLKTKKELGEFGDRTKKELLLIDREIAKLTRFYGGIEGMEKMPDTVFVVDVRREENACREAFKKGIPLVAICDTNCELSLVTYPIPGNDDAIKAIEIVTGTIADAYREGREIYAAKSAKEKVELAGEKAADIVKKNQIGSSLVNKEEPRKEVSRPEANRLLDEKVAKETKEKNES
jgi:small subunit ribosomal protein S2